MKKTSKLIAAILMVVMLFSMVACSPAAPAAEEPAATTEAAVTPEPVAEPMEFDMIYTKDDIATPMAEMVAAFQAENPNITAKVEVLGANSDQVIQSRDAAGDLPDVFPVYNIGAGGLDSWIKAGKIQDISSLKAFQALPQTEKDQVTGADGKAYSLVLSTTAFPVLYNKDLFAKAGITAVPRTFDEMKVVCEKLKAAGITPFGVGAKDGWTVSNQIWRAGLDYAFPKQWNADRYAGKASFMDYGKDIFPYLDLVLANSNAKVLDTDYMTQVTLVAEGKAAMINQGPWSYSVIKDLSPELTDKIGAFPIPFGNTASRNKMYTQQELAFVVSSKANLEAVDAFFSFMVTGNGKDIFGKGFNVQNPYGIAIAGNPVLTDIQSYIDKGEYMFDFQDNNRSTDFFMVDWTLMQEYIGGKKTQDQVLVAMDKAWDEAQAKMK